MNDPTPQQLVARAYDDAIAARAALPIDDISDAIVGFHSQQAVEKSIKAVLAHNRHTFPFTHDLEGLLERCEEVGIAVPVSITEGAGLLTPYAVRFRYGGDPPDLMTPDEAVSIAEAAVVWARAALAEV